MMRHKTKKIATGIMGGLLAVSLAACGGGGNASTGSSAASGGGTSTGSSGGKGTTIELAISKSSQDSIFVQQSLLDAFEKESGIKVNLQLLPAEQTATVLQTKLAVDETPDIVQYNLASATTDLNLERNFEILDNEAWASRLLNKEVLSAYGHIYSFQLSQDTGMQGVVYNKDLFKELGIEIPTDFDEFLAACEKIKAAGITPVFMPFKDNWAANIWPGAAFADYAEKNEPTLFEDLNAGKKKWSDIPAFADILQQQYEVYEKGYTNGDILSDSYDMAVGKFLNKEVAMMFMGDWLIQNVADKDPKMNLGLFPIPYAKDSKLGASPLGGQLFIPKKAKHMAEAKQFLDYVARKDVAQKIVDEQKFVSNFNDVKTPELPAWKQDIVDNYITPKKTVLTVDAHMLVDRSELYRLLQDEFAGGTDAQGVLTAWDEKFAQLMKDKGAEGF